jgi:hypothetical protein
LLLLLLSIPVTENFDRSISVLCILTCSVGILSQTDILLFHRKKAESGARKGSNNNTRNIKPIEPDEIAEMNIEDLIVEELDASDKKLQLIDEKKIAHALDKYVQKSEAQALNEAVNEILTKKQRQLIKSGALSATQASGHQVDDDVEAEKESVIRKTKSKTKSKHDYDDQDDVEDMEEDDDLRPSRSTKKAKAPASSRRVASSSRKKKRDEIEDDDIDFDDDEVDVVRKPKSQPKMASSRGGRSRKAVSYAEASDDDNVMDPPPKSKRNTRKPGVDRSLDVDSDDEMQAIDDDDDDDDDDSRPPKKMPARGRTSRNAMSKKNRSNGKSLSQSQLSFTATNHKDVSQSRQKRYNDDDSDDSDDDNEVTPSARNSRRRMDDDNDDWGTAKSNSTFD